MMENITFVETIYNAVKELDDFVVTNGTADDEQTILINITNSSVVIHLLV